MRSLYLWTINPLLNVNIVPIASLSPIIPTPQAVLFDWDDTLIETWPYLWKLYQDTFARFGYVLTDLMNEATCREKAVRNGRQTFVDAMGEEVGLKARDYFLTTYGNTFIHTMEPLPGAKTILNHLKSQHIPMAIVSNKESTFLKHEITKLKWDHYFNSVVGRDVVGPKPNPAGVLHALNAMNLSPSHNIWFIGDSIVDHETARNAGCYSLAFGEKAPLSSPLIDVSVANWNQFIPILENIYAK
ncbi:MAG: HAD family hydrolase [Alphaproteobacteria bacterium]|nr:HAD family hydrolase [Alphaproteobacteria bacterium]